MKISPVVKATRYRDVRVGHLFLCEYPTMAQYFLKCYRKGEDDEELYQSLFLGPDFIPAIKHMLVFDDIPSGIPDDKVVLDFGTNFIVEANISQKNVMFEQLPGLVDSGNWLILTNDRHYIRADSGDRSPQFSACFVCLETGEVLYKLPELSFPVMVKAWSIRLAGTDDLLKKIPDPIVRVPSDPPQ